MKILNDYNNDTLIEKTWYKSSTVLYSECFDKKDDFKEVKIVFSNGRCYLYKGVNVQDYLLFREAKSQGKSINRYLAKKENGKPVYETIRLEDIDTKKLLEELREYDSIPKFILSDKDNITIIVNNNTIFSEASHLLNDEENKKTFFNILSSLNIEYKIIE